MRLLHPDLLGVSHSVPGEIREDPACQHGRISSIMGGLCVNAP